MTSLEGFTTVLISYRTIPPPNHKEPKDSRDADQPAYQPNTIETDLAEVPKGSHQPSGQDKIPKTTDRIMPTPNHRIGGLSGKS